jgi:hypothetical protein
VRDDRALALELDRALAGEDTGAEARHLAALLVAATEPARVDVDDPEVEHALAQVVPLHPRREPQRLRVAVAVAVALGAAVVAFAVLRVPGTDVQAQAARAIDGVYFAIEEIRPARPGLFAPTTSSGLTDARTGRGHWRVTSGGDLVTETAVTPTRVERYDAADDTLTVAPSCSAFAAGCADVLDPLDVYRRALEGGSAATEKVGDHWRLTLRGVGDVEQVVTVDGATYLPRLIEWREGGRPVSLVRFTVLQRETRARPEDFQLGEHPGATIRQLTATGAAAHVRSERPTEVPSGAYWLGPDYHGTPARAFAVETNAGEAIRIEYGPVVVWNYDTYLPADIVAATIGPAKVFSLPQGGTVRSYFNAARLVVADVEVGGRRVAVVSRGKIDVVEAARALRRHA